MYKYKREINEIDSIRKSTFILSDKIDTVLCLNSDFSVNKPFNGLYIKNGKVIISNLIEEFITKTNNYKISNILSVNSVSNTNDSYISSIDLENMCIKYETDDFRITKTVYLEEKTGIMAIQYEVENLNKYDATFKVSPAITYRNIYDMKNFSMLRFNQRNEENGVVVNLSITKNEDIVLKSDNMLWNKEVSSLNDITYNVREDNEKTKIYKEDLLIPGYFDIDVKSNSKLTTVIYICDKVIDISKLSIDEISKKDFFLKQKLQNSIEKEYIELKELVYGLDKFNLKDFFVTSLPFDKKILINPNTLQDTICKLTDLTRAIEGEFLCFGKIKDATKRVLDIQKYIKTIENTKIENYDTKYKLVILKLWLVESINVINQKHDLANTFFDLVKEYVMDILNDELYKEYLKNIEFVSLLFNALKIYEDMLNKKEIEEKIVYVTLEELKLKVERKFWNEEKRVLKKNLDEDEIYANIDMLYTVSLSYPCIGDYIQFKLLDTVFKELYNPYGLREYSKNTLKNTGLIYPKYMAHFVKANLRQNGVTRASRKIAFNLVRELLLDLNKYVNCGIKKVYSEKGYNIDKLPYDLLTNAEIVRLYDMLM